MLETIPSAAAELGNISLSDPGFLSIISFLILKFLIVPCARCVCAVCAVLVASAELSSSSSECRTRTLPDTRELSLMTESRNL